MPCYRWIADDGTEGHICGDFGSHCAACGTVSTLLCDYPVGNDKTCDRAICEHCAHEVGADIHYCAGHYAEWEKFVTGELANVRLIQTTRHT
jgi:hypothetical protein